MTDKDNDEGTMTKEQALKELAECKDSEPEGGHSWADEVLLCRLRALGEYEVVAAWKAITPKWYA